MPCSIAAVAHATLKRENINLNFQQFYFYVKNEQGTMLMVWVKMRFALFGSAVYSCSPKWHFQNEKVYIVVSMYCISDNSTIFSELLTSSST